MAKRASDLSTNSIAQVVLANYLNNGLYPAHLERVKALYRERRDVMLAAMNRHLGSLFLAEQYFSRTLTPADEPRRVTWQIPEGGLFIWAKLPGGLSSRELLKYAEREGVSFSPGDLFFASFGENEYFRLCFIQNEKSLIEQGIERLSRAVGTFFERSMRQKMPVKNIAYKGSENVLV
jgi:DNA-binding transcriptional MocR family regulator